MKQARDPDDVHPPLAGYVHQIELTGTERLLVLSGQVGVRPDGSIPHQDPLDQLDVAWDNVERNLQAAGMGTDDLVKVTLYLVGDIDTARRQEVLAPPLGRPQAVHDAGRGHRARVPPSPGRGRRLGEPSGAVGPYAVGP